jgi:hypothetical protein
LQRSPHLQRPAVDGSAQQHAVFAQRQSFSVFGLVMVVSPLPTRRSPARGITGDATGLIVRTQ